MCTYKNYVNRLVHGMYICVGSALLVASFSDAMDAQKTRVQAPALGCSESFPPANAGVQCTYQKLSDWVQALPALSPAQTFLDSSLFLALCRHMQEMYLQELCSGAWYENNTIFLTEAPTKSVHEFNAQKFLHCYVQKMRLKEHDSVYMFGDLHGDVHSLIRGLQKLHEEGVLNDDFTLKENCYLVFLGDYGDRGMWSAEVLYLVCTLKSKNFKQVILLRGNHEDKNMNEALGNLGAELSAKFGLTLSQREEYVYALYDFMPLALYLGTLQESVDETQRQWVLCCHGGPELGFSPRKFLSSSKDDYLWLSKIDRSKEIASLPVNLKDAIVEYAHLLRMSPFVPKNKCLQDEFDWDEFLVSGNAERGLNDIGFLWNDFLDSSHDEGPFQFNYGRGCAFGAELTQKIMERDGLCTIIRGHQHNGPLYDELCLFEGCAPLFDSLVYTVLSGNIIVSEPLLAYAFIKVSRSTQPSHGGWDVELLSQPYKKSASSIWSA
ncbi:hypothetical protein CVU75_03015 [Candidatus Dependentiae bacterium HGW-Dependentiae-1]|nr:MAG: hypothetical protein CVU75_03015 [Candidatus Dependentiae bacterium HGW-Dependentiae-1]